VIERKPEIRMARKSRMCLPRLVGGSFMVPDRLAWRGRVSD
jgi:hypothetical protein